MGLGLIFKGKLKVLVVSRLLVRLKSFVGIDILLCNSATLQLGTNWNFESVLLPRGLLGLGIEHALYREHCDLNESAQCGGGRIWEQEVEVERTRRMEGIESILWDFWGGMENWDY